MHSTYPIRTFHVTALLALAGLMAAACYPVGGEAGPQRRPPADTTPAVNAFIDDDGDPVEDDEVASPTTTAADAAEEVVTSSPATIAEPPTTTETPTTTEAAAPTSESTATSEAPESTAPTATSTQPTTTVSPTTSAPNPPGGARFPVGPFVMPEGDHAADFSGGWIRVVPDDIIEQLDAARASGRSVAVNFVRSKKYSQNEDETFNLDKWKGMVDLYADFDIDSYIDDGTILVHYLLDEPKARAEWGGEVIPNDVIDEMARYSKERWPTLTTAVRVQPTKLAKHADGYGIAHPGGWTWSYLDAGWGQYSFRKGPVEQFVSEEVAEANAQGIGLVFGMNVLNGGAGPGEALGWSQRGYDSSKYTMSPAELRHYGTAMIDAPLACGLVMWRYYDDATFRYFDIPEISDAMVDLTAHATTRSGRPCRP